MTSFENIKIQHPIITAEEFIIKQRKYTPDYILNQVNEKITIWLSNIDICNSRRNNIMIDITEACKGYKLNEIKQIIKLLITYYKKQGYYMTYSVNNNAYEIVNVNNKYFNKYLIQVYIKSISFKKSKSPKILVAKPNLDTELPPAYEQLAKKQKPVGNGSFLSHFVSCYSKNK
jgi:hypothetical protein